jgi:hypothetical protein
VPAARLGAIAHANSTWRALDETCQSADASVTGPPWRSEEGNNRSPICLFVRSGAAVSAICHSCAVRSPPLGTRAWGTFTGGTRLRSRLMCPGVGTEGHEGFQSFSMSVWRRLAAANAAIASRARAAGKTSPLARPICPPHEEPCHLEDAGMATSLLDGRSAGRSVPLTVDDAPPSQARRPQLAWPGLRTLRAADHLGRRGKQGVLTGLAPRGVAALHRPGRGSKTWRGTAGTPSAPTASRRPARHGERTGRGVPRVSG